LLQDCQPLLQNCYPLLSFLFCSFLVVTNLLAIGIDVLACPSTYAVALLHHKKDKPLNITVMKKHIILALALFTLSLTACEEEPVTLNAEPHAATAPAITSFFPESSAIGSEVVISGNNFGASIADNYVTFSGAYAEVTEAGHGMVRVRVPLNLAQGDYTINLSANGLTSASTKIFKVTRF
jgi:hypothetical protein